LWAYAGHGGYFDETMPRMMWKSCLNGACSRFEKPTQESKCPVCGERTGLYEPPRQPEPLVAPSRSAGLDENVRRVAERRQQWSQATGVPLAARPDVPFALAASSHVQRHSGSASGWNYLWLLLGLVGGIAGNLMVRDTDPAMAKRLLIGGVIVTVGIPLLLILLIVAAAA
jgi:hypothetical protein